MATDDGRALPFLARWRHRRWVLLGGAAAAWGTGSWMNAVPHGDVVLLQLSGATRALAARRLEDWPLASAEEFLWRDYAFLATYWVPMTILAGMAAGRYAKRGLPSLARRGWTVAWLPVGVALLDAVENVFLIAEVREVRRTGTEAYGAGGPAHLAPLATVTAWCKWLLVLVWLAYVVAAVFAKRRHAPPARQSASTTAS